MSQKCINDPENFCYICGEVTFASRKCSITPTIKQAYFLYFCRKVGDQDKKWAPHVCCTTCSYKLNAWVNGKGCCMLFGVPMVWRVPSNHSTDCYFCMVCPIQNCMFMKKKNQHLCTENTISNLAWASWQWTSCSWTSWQFCYVLWRWWQCFFKRQPSASRDADYLASTGSSNHKITEGELNDLIRDLELPKNKVKLLTSTLQQWKLLHHSMRVAQSWAVATIHWCFKDRS